MVLPIVVDVKTTMLLLILGRCYCLFLPDVIARFDRCYCQIIG